MGACTHKHIDPTYTKINTIGINYIVHLIVWCSVYCIAYCNKCPIFYSILSCTVLCSSHSCTAHMGSRRPLEELVAVKQLLAPPIYVHQRICTIVANTACGLHHHHATCRMVGDKQCVCLYMCDVMMW